MKLLAIDQSTSCLGYAVLETDSGALTAHGAIPVRRGTPDEKISRVKQLVCALIDEHQPECFALEDIQLQGNNHHTFKVLAELLGVICNLYFERSYLYLPVPPISWKRFIGIRSNTRAAQKAETICYVAAKYGFDPSEDEADAVGIAEYAAHQIQARSL